MRIAADAPRPVWDEFEFAVECVDWEIRSYYDTVTGEVLVTGPFEDDPGERERIDAEPARYLEIGQLDAPTELEWMRAFTATVGDAHLRHELERDLAARKPFRRFKDGLLDAPAERQRWFAFRDRQVKLWIEQWFDERELAVGAPPAWWTGN